MTPLRFAVIGDPVAHSRSPAMHRAAFRALGLPHTYEALRVTDAELPGVVQALREGTFAGLNVTLPHKTRVLEHVDDVSASVRQSGAANTLVRTDDGRVEAHNTDLAGLTLALQQLTPPGLAIATGRALVLGSGGAARAAVQVLAHLGFRDIAVRARRAGVFDDARIRAWQPLEASPESERGTLVVIQATSAGMQGAGPGEGVAAAVAWQDLPAEAVALDVVYAPPETPFLQAARRRGLRCANGLGMLAGQGARALELWLGSRAVGADGSPGPGLQVPLDVMLAELQKP